VYGFLCDPDGSQKDVPDDALWDFR
jgi:hypothetical protein